MDREKSVVRVYSSNQPTEPEQVPIPLKVTLTIKEAAKFKYRYKQAWEPFESS